MIVKNHSIQQQELGSRDLTTLCRSWSEDMFSGFSLILSLENVRRSTYLEQSSCKYSGNQNPSCFQKTVETVLDQYSQALDIVMTENILVKHHRRGLPATVLHKSSSLHYITLSQFQSCCTLYVTDFFEISRISRFMKGLKSAFEVGKSILGHF